MPSLAWDRARDYADSTSVISFYGRRRPRLPERGTHYYTRTHAKSRRAAPPVCSPREENLLLAGESRAQGARTLESCWPIETRLAKASLTITEQRDPQN